MPTVLLVWGEELQPLNNVHCTLYSLNVSTGILFILMKIERLFIDCTLHSGYSFSIFPRVVSINVTFDLIDAMLIPNK